MYTNFPLYPTEIFTVTDYPVQTDNTDTVYAALINALRAEMQACFDELGVLPKGDFASVGARLTYNQDQLVQNFILKKDLLNESPAQDRIYSLTFDSQNNRIIAGTYPDAQLWISTDGGDTWTLKKDLSNESPAQDRINSLTFDSQNNRIIAGTGPDAQLWISTDGGDTWMLKKDLSNETPAQTRILNLTFDSQNNRIIAGTYPDAQLWISLQIGEI